MYICSVYDDRGLLTDNEALWEKAWAFKNHEKSYEAVYRRQHMPGFRWLHESFGTNWRMTEIVLPAGRFGKSKKVCRS